MDYTRLGNTGMEVCRICLGCMSFGDSTRGREWTLELDQSRPIVRAAWEAGNNFYDTRASHRIEDFIGIISRLSNDLSNIRLCWYESET